MIDYEAYKDAIEAEPKDYTVNSFIMFDSEDGNAKIARFDYAFVFEGRNLKSWFEIRLIDGEYSPKQFRDFAEMMVRNSIEEAKYEKENEVGVYANAS